MRRALGLVLACSVVGSGCFHYVPLSEPPTQGMPVRAHLEPPVEVDLTHVTARSVVRVQGEVVASHPDQLVLSAFHIWGDNGLDWYADGETVRLPASSVALLELKRLSGRRTVLAAVGLVAASYLVQATLRAAVGGGEGGGPPGSSR
jgi:hypothetical protein